MIKQYRYKKVSLMNLGKGAALTIEGKLMLTRKSKSKLKQGGKK